MGKKVKVGKQRKDNYYKLAKQKGFRSRAAFKLIQLNRKFQFLENSRVCIDLCAAPGGWLQVASEYMPVSSVILGIDLVPITPIRNVITFQADITTKECSETIENNLSNWKADIVLHDGAPNVGRNWLHDAYSQNVLVVHALKIACNHLNKGGWFVTKIFRSTDYNSLLWVFGKLFGKVHATKPQASRQESAEIFVVCQNYKKPQQIDPRFFDPSTIFADISNFDEALRKKKADLLKPANKIKKTKAQGYEDGDSLKIVKDVQFVTEDSYLDYLAQYHEIKLENADILAHESTTDEIKECCKDLKILGTKEIRQLLKWRTNLRVNLIARLMNSETGEDSDNLDHLTINEDDEDTVPELQLDDFELQQDEEKHKETKRLKRKDEKRIKDYQQRVNYGMVNHGDVLIEEENDLFSLKTISGKNELDKMDDVEPDELVDEPQEPEENRQLNQKKSVTFSRETDVQYFELEGEYDSDDDDNGGLNEEKLPAKLDETKIKAPNTILKSKDADAAFRRLSKNSTIGGGLLTDLMDINQSKISAASKFFDRDTFSSIDLEKEFEIDQVNLIVNARNQSKSSSQEKIAQPVSDEKEAVNDDLSRFDDASSSDGESSGESEDSEPVKKKKQTKLDPQGLALASMMISSETVRKDIEDEGWNRFAHGDSHLAPKWFREEEDKHCRRNIPVRQELVKEYKQKLREIDAKPIKKVMEAKARQKRRAMRKMEKVKKKVDAIITNEDMTQRERINQIKTVYKNATKTKKKELKLVVGRKGLPAKKPTKGKYKMVDKRMKKDLRGSDKRQSKGKPKRTNNRSSNNKPANNRSSNSRPQNHKSKKGPSKNSKGKFKRSSSKSK